MTKRMFPERPLSVPLVMVVCGFALIVGAQQAAGQTPLFSDGFECGSACRWSAMAPAAPCQGLFYWGDFDTDGVDEVARVDFPGPVRSILSLAGLTGGDAIRSVAVSPDGLQIAVAGESGASDPGVVNVYTFDGSGTPTTLVDASTFTNTSAQIFDLAYSPDGEWVSFLADADLSGEDALWVVPSSGVALAKRVSQSTGGDTARDVKAHKWHRFSTTPTLAYIGDLTTNNTNNIWSVDPAPATPAPVALCPSHVDVTTDIDFDANGRVYYVGEYPAGVYVLYRVDIDGQNLEAVPGTNLQNDSLNDASVGSFAISPDGWELAFSADAPTLDLYQVYVMNTASGAPVLVSGITTTLGSGSRGLIAPGSVVWNPAGNRLAVLADWEVDTGDLDNQFSAFVLPASGPPGGARLLGVSADSSMDAVQLLFSSDSQRLFVRGDLRLSGDHELYSTDDLTTQDQSAATTLLEAVPAAGDVDGMVLPY